MTSSPGFFTTGVMNASLKTAGLQESGLRIAKVTGYSLKCILKAMRMFVIANAHKINVNVKTVKY